MSKLFFYYYYIILFSSYQSQSGGNVPLRSASQRRGSWNLQASWTYVHWKRPRNHHKTRVSPHFSLVVTVDYYRPYKRSLEKTFAPRSLLFFQVQRSYISAIAAHRSLLSEFTHLYYQIRQKKDFVRSFCFAGLWTSFKKKLAMPACNAVLGLKSSYKL